MAAQTISPIDWNKFIKATSSPRKLSQDLEDGYESGEGEFEWELNHYFPDINGHHIYQDFREELESNRKLFESCGKIVEFARKCINPEWEGDQIIDLPYEVAQMITEYGVEIVWSPETVRSISGPYKSLDLSSAETIAQSNGLKTVAECKRFFDPWWKACNGATQHANVGLIAYCE